LKSHNVRLATPDDINEIIRLIGGISNENGLFPLAVNKITKLVHDAVVNRTMVIGVIGQPANIEASIALAPGQLWYTDTYNLGDLWHYVWPQYRNSNHAENLIEFAKSVANQMGMDFISGVVAKERVDAKMRLYRKHFDAFLGGCFLHRHMNGSA
jgi:N-acetylglutamate synthase-like GNAT family acetyltransferase